MASIATLHPNTSTRRRNTPVPSPPRW